MCVLPLSVKIWLLAIFVHSIHSLQEYVIYLIVFIVSAMVKLFALQLLFAYCISNVEVIYFTIVVCLLYQQCRSYSLCDCCVFIVSAMSQLF